MILRSDHDSAMPYSSLSHSPWFQLSRRDLRLGSGLVLFVYVATHLANHALGLVSIGLADDALEVIVTLWHSLPGTVLLYGAVLLHVALALDAVYERRTFRMPPAELLRIVLGFTIPTLLIGHVVGTRAAFELHNLAPEYHRVVWTLWQSDSQGRQLALLAPGWIHGCMGLHFALNRRAGYRRWSLVFFGAALLLPVLSAAGFIAMMRELSGPGAEEIQARLNGTLPTPTQGVAIAGLRDTVLALYAGAIGLVFLARYVRDGVERGRRQLVSISYPHRTVRVPRGWSVLEASRGFGMPHASMCGGRARCSTCRVRVLGGAENCLPPLPAERETLARAHTGSDIRLACQLRPIGDVVIEPLVHALDAATGRAGAEEVVEREMVVLLVAIADRASFMDALMPQDALYLLERIGTAIDAAIVANGGRLIRATAGERAAVFDRRDSLTAAMGQALAVVNQLSTLDFACDTASTGTARLVCCIDLGVVAARARGSDGVRVGGAVGVW